jgi:hypothetical protein
MNAAIAEYKEVFDGCLARIADEDEITDKADCARRMTEAYFRGRMDRERIDRLIAEREAVAA